MRRFESRNRISTDINVSRISTISFLFFAVFIAFLLFHLKYTIWWEYCQVGKWDFLNLYCSPLTGRAFNFGWNSNFEGGSRYYFVFINLTFDTRSWSKLV